MTQKEKWDIADLKVEALTEYLYFCMRENQVPLQDIVISIKGCNVKDVLNQLIELYKSN